MTIDFEDQYPNYPILSWSQADDTNVFPPSGSLQGEGYISSSIPQSEHFNFFSKMGLGHSLSVSQSIDALKTPIEGIQKHKDFFEAEIEDHLFNTEKEPQRFRGHAIGHFFYRDRGLLNAGSSEDTSPKGLFRYEGICTPNQPLLFGYPRQPLLNRNITRERYDQGFRRNSGFVSQPADPNGLPNGFIVNLDFPIETIDYGVLVQVVDVASRGYVPPGTATNTNVGFFWSSRLIPWVRKFPNCFILSFRTRTGSTVPMQWIRNIQIEAMVFAREIKLPINTEQLTLQQAETGNERRHPERF